MWKYPVQVDGMMCGMCESHVNDAVRKGISREEGHLVPEQEGDHGAHGNGTGRGCPACGYFRYRV